MDEKIKGIVGDAFINGIGGMIEVNPAARAEIIKESSLWAFRALSLLAGVPDDRVEKIAAETAVVFMNKAAEAIEKKD